MDVDEIMEWKYALIFEKKEDADDAAEILRKNTSANPNSQKKIDAGMLTCSDCKKTIPQNVADFSQKFYGKHLCRECQLKHEKVEEGE